MNRHCLQTCQTFLCLSLLVAIHYNTYHNGLLVESFSPTLNALFSTKSTTNRNRATSSSLSSTNVVDRNQKTSNSPRVAVSRQDRLTRRRKEKKDPSDIEIKFIGTNTVFSPTSTISNRFHVQWLTDFFAMEQNRNLLFPANEATPLRGALTSTQIETWFEQAELGGGEGPILNWNNGRPSLANDDELQQKLFRIQAPLQMPGLKIVSDSTIGMKLLFPTAQNNITLPEYQFSLLESKLIPNGPPPVVWFFNQLMKYRDTTSSFTRVRAEMRGNHDIAFVTEARLDTSVRLPSKMLNVLPNVNVARFEKQGSEAIQKLLEKDLEPALNDFCDAFMAYSLNRGRKRQPRVALRP